MSDMPTSAHDELHATLDKLLIERAMIEQMDYDEQQDWAPVLARAALGFAACVCGSTILKASYGAEPDPADRAACLEALSDRLSIVARFFAECSTAGIGSLEATTLEAYMVASGDKPSAFAPLANRPGKRANATALAHLQLGALEWEVRMGVAGLAAAERQAILASAYGQTWDAMVKWKEPLERSFGKDVVDYRLEVARRTMDDLVGMQGAMIALDDIRHDGAAYRRALGYSV
jgi:hypothetical protein